MYQASTDPAPNDESATVAPSAATEHLSAPARGFIAELTQAMQAAAEHQREATNSEVEAMTQAHLERVKLRAAAEADELRRMAQVDIDEINAWQEAEAVRLREEAARRIIVRGEELDDYLVRHAALIDSEVDTIEGAVADYQMQLDEYFVQLTHESSPSEIARLADELPEPPDLGKVGGEARAQALAAVAAEDDAAFSPEAPGPDLVPVMAATNGSNGASHGTTDGTTNGTSNGTSNGSAESSTNPALRLLRSIATAVAPTPETKPAAAEADAAVAVADPEPAPATETPEG